MAIPYHYVTTAFQVDMLVPQIRAAKAIGLDLETTGLDPLRHEVRLVQFRLFGGKTNFVCDLWKLPNAAGAALIQALAESKGLKVGHGLHFDQKFLLYHFGCELHPVFDTFRAEVLLQNGVFPPPRKNLWAMFERYLGIVHESMDHQVGGWDAPELTPSQLEYAAEDVHYLPSLYEQIRRALHDAGLSRTMRIECDAILPEAAVELNGFCLDADAWNALLEKNRVRRDELAVELHKTMPLPVAKPKYEGLGFLPGMDRVAELNLDSPPQILSSLQLMGCRVEDTSGATLAALVGKHPIVKTLMKYREAAKRCTSYAQTYLDAIHPVTGRVHASYKGDLATGRYRIEKPQLGNIPREKAYRFCFVSGHGRRLVVGDWSNIEMRIIAELSGDRRLIDTFRRGLDAHKVTAESVLGIPYAEITKEQKQQSKPLNFGFGYGMGANRLVEYALHGYGVTLSEKEAVAFRRKWFQLYAGVGRWHEVALEEGRKNRCARTIAGRRRFLDPTLHGEFLNTPVQGTGADGQKRALRKVYDLLKKMFGVPPARDVHGHVPPVMMVHHLHDEIVLEADEPRAVAAEAVLNRGMREAMEEFLTAVPVVVETGVGTTWADKA